MLTTSNNLAAVAAQVYVIFLVDVLQSLIRFDDWSSMTPTACRNVGLPRFVQTATTEDVTTARDERAVEKPTRCVRRIWSTLAEGSRNTSWLSIESIPLLAERTCLQTVLLYRCSSASDYNCMISFNTKYVGSNSASTSTCRLVWSGTSSWIRILFLTD